MININIINRIQNILFIICYFLTISNNFENPIIINISGKYRKLYINIWLLNNSLYFKLK
jgi:hypothetical protein